jgi:hypothetical protein
MKPRRLQKATRLMFLVVLVGCSLVMTWCPRGECSIRPTTLGDTPAPGGGTPWIVINIGSVTVPVTILSLSLVSVGSLLIWLYFFKFKTKQQGRD